VSDAHVVLDGTALLVLAAGNWKASTLLVEAERRGDLRLWMPTLCILDADERGPTLAAYVGALEMLHPVPLDFEAALAICELRGGKLSAAMCAAVHAARPSLERPDGAVIATMTPEAYKDAGVPVLDLNG